MSDIARALIETSLRLRGLEAAMDKMFFEMDALKTQNRVLRERLLRRRGRP